MKVKELLTLLAEKDPEAVVLIAGFETDSTPYAAEADTVADMQTVPAAPHIADPMTGNRQCVSSGGEPSVWIGWQGDYRTETFIRIARNPDEDD
ncbi:hypothetical protein [Erwinia amylovora]|uniref:hypothetical protein n=1 Tax=Erwinia amylovora TaxID=552 RepID=UPI0020BDB0C2|nr:hypothetical protein [Erwinia amylovora]MCK8417616.1 hypothetical protein [Erwinia amylovora]